MPKITQKVTLHYNNDVITIKGQTFTAVMEITSDQLRSMYFGGNGSGTVTLHLPDPDPSKE